MKTNFHISTYTNSNFSTITAMLWSPLNEEYMICGNRDQTIKIWHIVNNTPKDKACAFTNRLYNNSIISKLSISALIKERKALIKDVSEKKKGKQDEPKPLDDATSKKKWKTVLHATSKMQNNANSIEAIRCLMSGDVINKSAVENNSFLKLFGDKSDIMDIINLERKL